VIARPAFRANKRLLQGGEVLFARAEWAPLQDIQGDDQTMFKSPVIQEAFERVLHAHRPNSPIMLTSLCTSTRPYTASRKWWLYDALLGDVIDLVVCSNGGIVPLRFESQYPFLNYDAKGQARFDEEYIEVVGGRLKRFLLTHSYRHVVFAFLQGMRNRVIAEDLGPWLVHEGVIEGFAILPSDAVRQQVKEEGAHETLYVRHPDLWPCCVKELVLHVRSVCRLYGVRMPKVEAIPADVLREHSVQRKPRGLFE